MTRYMLFTEYNDVVIWGDTLADALTRRKIIHKQKRLDTERGTKFVLDLDNPLTIARILGMRNTSNSRRGNWMYESAVCELSDGSIIEVDARVVETI